MKMKRKLFVLFLCVILSSCSAANKSASSNGDSGKSSYTHISQDEAKKMMETDDGHVIVDVRRADEYASGHIPGAILIPNETIGKEKPVELSDLDQIILVYCRSGNRSSQAAKKLADLGYKNVYDFGGIMSWTGDVVKEP